MLGIEGDCTVYTGPEIDNMDDPTLESIVLGCNVYARASPENKLRIVRALQVSCWGLQAGRRRCQQGSGARLCFACRQGGGAASKAVACGLSLIHI